MKQSKLYIPTLRENPKDAEIISHKFLLRGGYIKQTAAGLYTYLPLAKKIINNIENIIREELDNIGCNEIIMPILQPKDLWVKSERWDKMGGEMMRISDRNKREFALGPTHEEIITDLVKDYANSYKKLPIALYQIHTKFRDELRPRFGLMRSREFIMKDLYTFHSNDNDLDLWYKEIKKAYLNIFKRVGLNVRPINADNGSMGGKDSHEFVAISEIGEDDFTYCPNCDYGENDEIEKNNEKCPKCNTKTYKAKGIELGHIFKLGTTYSKKINANFNDSDQKKKPLVMGCYGIGVSRIVMAIIEQNYKNDYFKWPKEVSPYDVHILLLDDKKMQLDYLEELLNEFKKNNISYLVDERKETPGSKFKDSELIAIPKVIIVGKLLEKDYVEIILKNNEKKQIQKQKVIDYIL